MEFLLGLLFSILWASASVATRFGIQSADPLMLALIRFLAAGTILLIYCYLIKRKDRLPKGKEWAQITIFGLFNTTIYLGCFVIAVQSVSVGLVNLFIAINPLLIALLSAIWLKRKIKKFEIAGFLICFAGLLTATIPSLLAANSSLHGILILAFGMFAYSFASVYYARMNVKLSNVAINGWQVFIGGIAMLPLVFLFQQKAVIWDKTFILSLAWLVIAVSIITLAIWFYMLKKDTVRASQWLYLSPVIGYILSYFLLDESISFYAVAGTALVITGLVVGRRRREA